jgi:hypothetical protein
LPQEHGTCGTYSADELHPMITKKEISEVKDFHPSEK